MFSDSIPAMNLTAALRELKFKQNPTPRDYSRDLEGVRVTVCIGDDESRVMIYAIDTHSKKFLFNCYFQDAPVSVIRATLLQIISENS